MSSVMRIVALVSVMAVRVTAFRMQNANRLRHSCKLSMEGGSDGEKQILNKYSRVITEPPSQGNSLFAKAYI